MKLKLLFSEEAKVQNDKLVELVNSLQSLFAVESAGRIVFPKPSGLRPPSSLELQQWLFESNIAPNALGDQHFVLLTSRPIEGLDPTGCFLEGNIAIVSDNLETVSPDATVIWFARRVLRIGVRKLLKQSCDTPICICGKGSEFVALCGVCQEALKQEGFRDGIIALKEAINWLNQHHGDAGHPGQLPGSTRRISTLPLAASYAEKYQSEGKAPLAGKTVLMVLHFLSDLLPFVSALVKLGATYKDMVLIAKPYPYASRDYVTHELELLGVEVYRASRRKGVSALATEILSKLKAAADLQSRQILIVEDGGYFTPILHQTEFASVALQCIGVVEQTTKGIKQDQKSIQTFKVPILSVATSTFKGEYESPEIGRVTIQNIGRFVPNVKLSGREAVVFGFGSIGEQVAANLNRAFNMGVRIVEPDPAKQLKAYHRKDIVIQAKDTFDGLDLRGKPAIVVGTTGEKNTISEAILRQLPAGCILVSTSSDRDEIEMEALERIAAAEEVEEGNTVYRWSADGNFHELIVLAEGYPLNFYASESLPNETIDPIMTLLLLCAIELCENLRLAKGVNTKTVNDVTRDRQLIEEVLKRC